MKFAKLFTGFAVLTFVGLFSMPTSVETAAAQTSNADFDIALDHVALSVPDLRQSVAWYQQMFGFKEVRRSGEPNGMQTALIRRGDVRIELFQVPGAAPLPGSRRNPSEDFRTEGVKHFAFRVKDVRAALAELQAKGVKIVFELHDYPGAAFAFVSDNAGNAVELIQYKQNEP
ncbi:MAG: VOC family protein [Acidobacteriota bacterium]|nr:VOC family protein [Acidobacteriota bacterium]